MQFISTNGVLGILGGFISAMVVATYQISPLPKEYLNLLNLSPSNRTLSQQAGIQIACTFISIGISLLFGIISGLVINLCYNL